MINKAKKPVKLFCLNENKRSIAHAISGTFLVQEAIKLMIKRIPPFNPQLLEPNTAKQKAMTAAHVVEAAAIRKVSASVFKISEKYFMHPALGIKFFTSQMIPKGSLKTAEKFLNSAIIDAR